eukprot:PhM_4_TR18908/c0_g1_i1/m.67050
MQNFSFLDTTGYLKKFEDAPRATVEDAARQRRRVTIGLSIVVSFFMFLLITSLFLIDHGEHTAPGHGAHGAGTASSHLCDCLFRKSSQTQQQGLDFMGTMSARLHAQWIEHQKAHLPHKRNETHNRAFVVHVKYNTDYDSANAAIQNKMVRLLVERYRVCSRKQHLPFLNLGLLQTSAPLPRCSVVLLTTPPTEAVLFSTHPGVTVFVATPIYSSSGDDNNQIYDASVKF